MNNKKEQIPFAIDVKEKIRIVLQPNIESKGFMYNDYIFAEIPEHEAYSYLFRQYETETKKTATREKVKMYFPELFLTETDKDMSQILIGTDGHAYDLKRLREIKETTNNHFIDTSWIKQASEYKDNVPTQVLGAKYILPEYRQKEPAIENYFREMITDDENFKIYMTAIVKGFILEVSTKNFIVCINPVKNATKTTAAKIIKRMFGTYADILPLSYITPKTKELDSNRYFYNHKNIRFMMVAEMKNSIILDENKIKALTGREDMAVPYGNSSGKIFNSNFQLFGGSTNVPFKPETKISELSDRLFYLPFGKVLPPSKRIKKYEDVLSTEEELDLFFSFLIDSYYPYSIDAEIKRTRIMVLADDYARLLYEPVRFFLEKCCIRGVSSSHSNMQKYSCSEVHTFFLKFIRLYWIYVMGQLKFDCDAEGNLLSYETLLSQCSFPTYNDFKKQMDRELGAATDDERCNRGYMWRNLFVKTPLVYFFNNENVKDHLANMDILLTEMDKLQTVQDAINSFDMFKNDNSVLLNTWFAAQILSNSK